MTKFRRAAAGAAVAGGVLATVAIEIASLIKRQRHEPVIAERSVWGANQVVVAFPAFAADATSLLDIMPYFGSVNTLIVNYAMSGHNSDRLFAELAKRLRKYAGQDIVLFGVSFGAGVAVGFRRYLLAHPELGQGLGEVRLVFYSPVTAFRDLKGHMRPQTALGFALWGGWISNHLWRLYGGTQRLHVNAPPFVTEVTAERLEEILASVDRHTLALLSSECRALLMHRPARPGEFRSDSALIFSFEDDGVMAGEVPRRLAEAFGRSEIVQITGFGHADIYRIIMIERIMQPALSRFLAE